MPAGCRIPTQFSASGSASAIADEREAVARFCAVAVGPTWLPTVDPNLCFDVGAHPLPSKGEGVHSCNHCP